MPPEHTGISVHQWSRVQALFEEMLDSSNPMLVLQAEADSKVAHATRKLWHNHVEASAKRFLDEPITMIRELTSPDQQRFRTGEVLAGRFVIERLLGTGGMGEVYQAQDQRLQERVALKTIRKHLASDSAICRRFLAEIQNARRVTHPNVCRIYDLFDERHIPFFSMEYLEGPRLSEWIRDQRYQEDQSRRVAWQLAEGLAAAHLSAIVHGDFKPANVILTGEASHPRVVITDFGLARALPSPKLSTLNTPLRDGVDHSPGTPGVDSALDGHSLRAGTLSYMAPELLSGAPATISSDIYAFGKVLAELLPSNRLVGQCLAERPEARPRSMDPLIAELRGSSTRRNWLIGSVAVVGAGIASYRLRGRTPVILAGRQQIVITGFQSKDVERASIIRELLITALRQSPLLSVVADDHLRTLLRRLGRSPALPTDHGNFFELAGRERIAIILEGSLQGVPALRIFLQAFEPGALKPFLSFSEEIGDGRQIVRLAEIAALRLRRELGESTGSLRAAYTPLEQVTSASPEAADAYFRGVREYEAAHAKNAQALFDQAISIDPQFALAHLHRGIALAARFQVGSGLESYQRAFTLRGRVSERERLWIESRYYNIIGDYVSSLETCHRLALLYPEEATFQRHTALAFARTGRPKDALPFNRRSVELDSVSDNNISELIVNHTDADLYDDALALHRQFRADGHTSTLLDWGAGLAYMGKGEYAKASGAFEAMAVAPERERWSRLLRCAPLILQGDFAKAASDLASDLAYDITTGEQNRRQIRRVWLGMLDWMMDAPGRAHFQARELVQLDASPAWLQMLREGGILAATLGHLDLARESLDRLREIERRWPSTHTRGARAHLEALTLLGRDSERTNVLMSEARGLWPDPLTLFSVAQWQAVRDDCTAGIATLDLLDRQRGRILRYYFPGLIVLIWVERARCLARLSRFDESVRVYEQVLNHWLQHAGQFGIMQQVRHEHAKLMARHS